MMIFLPQWFQIFFFSMFPYLEARYIIPYSMIVFEWEWWQAFPLAVLGNILPVPCILLFFHHVEKFLRRYQSWSRLMNWLFARTRKKANGKILRYRYVGLLLFVAIPLPFTGAWTGSLIAYLFNLEFKKSLFMIFVGILIAAMTMVLFTLYLSWILTYLGITVSV